MSCCIGYLRVQKMVKWTICCGFQSRTALCSGRRVLAMIGRLRPVERPIWPHFYSDGSVDWFPAAELPGGWSHTHIHTCTVGVLIHVCSTSACMHIHAIPGHARANTSTEASCCWWQRVCGEKWEEKKFKGQKGEREAERDRGSDNGDEV